MCYVTVVATAAAAAAAAVIDDNSAWTICLHLHVNLKLMYLFTENGGKNSLLMHRVHLRIWV